MYHFHGQAEWGGLGLLCAQRVDGQMTKKMGPRFLFGHHIFCPGQRPAAQEGERVGAWDPKTQSAASTGQLRVLGTGPGAG